MISVICTILWTYALPALILAGGLYLSFRTRFVQVRRFPAMLMAVFGKGEKPIGKPSPLQATMNALAGTIGTGNIVGVGQAIALGGPGAVFWMWCAAFAGMAVKYAEIVLAVKFRKAGHGGPMYYMESLGGVWKLLGACFAAACAIGSFGTGCLAQSGSIAAAVCSAAELFSGDPAAIRLLLAVSICALTYISLSGGACRVGRITEILVPFMGLIYIAFAAAVIIFHSENLLPALRSIVSCALTPKAALGGIGGFGTARAMEWGLRRGVLSNEAGMGTAAVIHGDVDAHDAARQGLFGIFEVFADTMIICSFTALALLCSGVAIPYGEMTGPEVCSSAFATVFGNRLGAVSVAGVLCLFAGSTILSRGLCGLGCIEYLFGKKPLAAYRALFAALAGIGCLIDLYWVWETADILNALMCLPNVISLLILSPLILTKPAHTPAYRS